MSDFVQPNNPYFKTLAGSTKRYVCFTDVPIVIKDGKNCCAWCGENEIKPPRRKYCSEACSNSMNQYFNPTHHLNIRAILERQDCKCAMCGHDYKPLILEEDAYRKNQSDEWAKKYPNERPWYNYDHFINPQSLHRVTGEHLDNKETRLQIDHIIPIAAGGDAFGLDNLQGLCVTCHKKKTKLDMYEIAKFKASNV